MEIVKTKRDKPPRILIHAEHGLGKSTLAASAPSPVFIQTEDGLDKIDANAIPLCKDFETLMVQLKQVYEEEHDFKTLVIDSADWAERLINEDVCRRGDKDSISDFGYGAGFQMAYESFERVIRALTDIRENRNMIIIITAHSQIKTYQNPLGADYDRHQIKLRDKNAELFLEWCDLVGFLRFQTHVTSERKGFPESTKAIGGSERVLSCAPNAAYVSKNRYGITSDISISLESGWKNLITAIKGGQ